MNGNYWWERPSNLSELGLYLSAVSSEPWNLAEFAKAIEKPWKLQHYWDDFLEWEKEQKARELEAQQANKLVMEQARQDTERNL